MKLDFLNNNLNRNWQSDFASGAGSANSLSIVKTGADATLPGSGQIISLISSFINVGPGGLYKDWSKDKDNGVAEVTKWVKQDGDSPQQEALDALRLMNERGFNVYIDTGKPTKYGDMSLTWDDVIKKLNRVGLQSEAAKLNGLLKGSPLTGSNAPAVLAQELNNAPATRDYTQAEKDAADKKKKAMYIVIAVVVVALLIGAGLYLLRKKK